MKFLTFKIQTVMIRFDDLNINKAKEIATEIDSYVFENKLPEKILFMKNVI